MNIVSHRCYWLEKGEQNSVHAFVRSLEAGFGVEIDVRDANGHLVVSHDLPTPGSLSLEDYFSLYSDLRSDVMLCLNIKSDGLAHSLANLLERYSIENYAVFDMSVPDSLSYRDLGLKYLIRLSEYESDTSLLSQSAGIWVDSFTGKLPDFSQMIDYSEMDKNILFVSPELHSRKKEELWHTLIPYIEHFNNGNFAICTDFPQDFKEYILNASH